ncbi:putative B3 domain-containing protein [Cardamine amara subsp. amara]|uniref:B3 domain-containing protein n=1 Tax=Cardamine amara subsp. amara TaxID=228776 RepID=A0ABD1BL11_CARAN
MATSTEDITSKKHPEEVLEAASILMQLNYDYLQKLSLLQVSQAHQKSSTKRKRVYKKPNMTKISVEVDVSEVLMMAIEEWFEIELDPREIFHFGDVMGRFSKPIKKQLMMSDVTKNQSRLILSRQQVEETMLPLLEESENRHEEGLAVSVYGPDGEVQEMRFVIWNEGKTPVLTSGWKDFVAKYDLHMFSDFVTVWMFRHIKTRKICFAIDCTRFPIRQKFSGKILNKD